MDRAFIGQAPLTVIAMILVGWRLQIKPKCKPGAGPDEPKVLGSKLKRIDFLGALFMSTTILSAMLILDMGGQKVPWGSPLIAALGSVTVVAGILFYIVEMCFAKEPIFPLKLLSHKAVVLSYLTFAVQISSQMPVCINFYLQRFYSRCIAHALYSTIFPSHKEFRSCRSGSIPRSISPWQHYRWSTQRSIR